MESRLNTHLKDLKKSAIIFMIFIIDTKEDL